MPHERPIDPRTPPTAPAPATGSPDPRETEITPEEEPVTTGTLFLMIVFLMLIFGFWVILYSLLLDR